MKKVTVHVAKTQLSRLIEAALAGEDVVIAKRDKPLVRLVPIQGRFKFGVLPPGSLGKGPDFFAPMEENELAAWDGVPDDAPARHRCLGMDADRRSP